MYPIVKSLATMSPFIILIYEILNMAQLIIKGTKKYVSYMENHLHKEHPKTKRHTELKGIKEKK
jgi:hypothetical protein